MLRSYKRDSLRFTGAMISRTIVICCPASRGNLPWRLKSHDEMGLSTA
jgi:hypothetical protein